MTLKEQVYLLDLLVSLFIVLLVSCFYSQAVDKTSVLSLFLSLVLGDVSS